MGKKNRPPLLEALCLLSFAGNGTGFLLYLAAGLFFSTAERVIDEMSSMNDTSSLSPGYFFLFSLQFLVSLAGVFNMWKMRKSGFYIYIAAQIAIFAWPLLWLGTEAFSAVAAIFTLLFIILYASQYKKFKGQSLENSRILSR